MTTIDELQTLIKQLLETTKELTFTKNSKSYAAHLSELRGYHRILEMKIEKLENQHFKKAPEFGVIRAITRASETND